MLTYDIDEAVKFIADRTAIPSIVVMSVLNAKDEFLVGLELAGPELCDWTTLEEIRAVEPDYFTPYRIAQRYCNTDHERQYIAKRLGMTESDVRRIVAADEAYMRQQGIMG
jgi:hypothetical protein